MFKKKTPKFYIIIAAAALLAAFCAWYFRPVTLNVALYSYVPDKARFEAAVRSAWAEEHPGVGLNFVEWNCYSEDPPEDLDVFVFDCAFLNDYISDGFLLPLSENEIADAGDIFPFCLAACRKDDSLYAVPQLLCEHMLFTRKGDAELAGVNSIPELDAVLGDYGMEAAATTGSSGALETAESKADMEGLLANYGDSFSYLCLYYGAMIEAAQEYRDHFPLPEEGLDSKGAIETLQKLQQMAGPLWREELHAEIGTYPLAARFAAGEGRALISYSECMSELGDDAAAQYDIRPVFMTDQEKLKVLFMDAAGVRSGIRGRKRQLAVDLLNVLTGTDVLAQAARPFQEGESCQYLLLARNSAYEALKNDYPAYGILQPMISDPDNRIFLLKPSGKKYVEQEELALKQLP